MILTAVAQDALGNAATQDIDIAVSGSPLLVNIPSWTASQMASVFGSGPTVSLVFDPMLGIDVVRVLFPQSTSPSYTQGTVMLPSPTPSAWVRMLVKWEPGFTTVGPYPAGHDNSYKLFFILWQQYSARAGMGLSNSTRWNADWGIANPQTGVYYRPTETILPGSDVIGSITTEWSDDQWYEYVFGQVQVASDEVIVHHAWRRYTTSGVVNPGPWTHSMMSEKGNMTLGLPALTRVSLGGNKNKNNPTDMYIRWGIVQMAAGANPFGVA